LEPQETDVIVIGAGSIGISAAYYIKKHDPKRDVILVDRGQPMAFTSAQSGENYRNWWPHPVMKRMTDRSIDLMEALSAETDDQIALTRRGYVLATRDASIDSYLEEISACYGDSVSSHVRFHSGPAPDTYVEATEPGWVGAPRGVDVLENADLIRRIFPWLDPDVRNVIHIRRAGTVSGQQLGQVMLSRFRAQGGHRRTGTVTSISQGGQFVVELGGGARISSDVLVNAAGPFVNAIAGMLGVKLPVWNVLQQKIAFNDTQKAIPRRMPFTIDLDSQTIDWDDQDRDVILDDPDLTWLAQEMPSGIHCRPDGGDNGTWVKLGWAFNEAPVEETFEPEFNDIFPEIVLRGAARLDPALKTYYGRLPQAMSHYGGFYTMTEENWPLIGPMGVDGAFVVGAMSGFGTMAACAGGDLCAGWVLGEAMSDDARALSPARYDDDALMRELRSQRSKGIL
jgi:glycine/D-amino acid oxidase-like deaminating enzyme